MAFEHSSLSSSPRIEGAGAGKEECNDHLSPRLLEVRKLQTFPRLSVCVSWREFSMCLHHAPPGENLRLCTVPLGPPPVMTRAGRGEEARRRPPTTAELLDEGKKKRRFLRAVKREGETFLRRFATGDCPDFHCTGLRTTGVPRS